MSFPPDLTTIEKAALTLAGFENAGTRRSPSTYWKFHGTEYDLDDVDDRVSAFEEIDALAEWVVLDRATPAREIPTDDEQEGPTISDRFRAILTGVLDELVEAAEEGFRAPR